MPERWPGVLQAVADHVGALGGTLGRHCHADPRMIHTESLTELILGWIAGGYHIENARSAPLHRLNYPGFVTDHDVHSPEIRAALPCYRDFLTPRRADHGVGTAIAGVNNERLIVTFEAFPDAETMCASVPILDDLRPHLARAVALASELQLRECFSSVSALERVGAGAAILGERGQVIAANAGFTEQLGDALFDTRERLRLAHRAADAAFATSIARVVPSGHGTSVAIRNELGLGIAALHLIPVRRTAQEIFAGASVIALVSRPSQDDVPDSGLVQALFDLTPAETAVAVAISTGSSVEEIARNTEKSVETIRTHLKRVFSKTATMRQSELCSLLRGFAAPVPSTGKRPKQTPEEKLAFDLARRLV